ncbi:hypothetical protein GEMRC1_008217 [Eukaryota sp. GEM-RC1]
MDFTTEDVGNKSWVSFNLLAAAKKVQLSKNDSQIEELNRNSYSKFMFQRFVVSLLDRFVLRYLIVIFFVAEGEQFVKDFEELCK